jgi:hypothetical protein
LNPTRMSCGQLMVAWCVAVDCYKVDWWIEGDDWVE